MQNVIKNFILTLLANDSICRKKSCVQFKTIWIVVGIFWNTNKFPMGFKLTSPKSDGTVDSAFSPRLKIFALYKMRKPAGPNPLHLLKKRQHWIISQTVLNHSSHNISVKFISGRVDFSMVFQCVLCPTHGDPYRRDYTPRMD